MRLRGISRLWNGAVWLWNRFLPQAAILLYHRVAEVTSDPQLLSVRPQRFAEHLEFLSRDYRVVSLNTLVGAIEQGGRLADRLVAVTFDDGYRDNLLNAKPLLERYEIPATVFVTTGYIDQAREFWWDELERLLLQPSTVPATLRLKVNGHVCEWDLEDTAEYREEDFARHCRWNVVRQGDPTARQRVYRALCRMLRPMPEKERERVLEELRIWSGAKAVVRDTHRCLRRDEVNQLGSGKMVEVGAHSVSHSVLSKLSSICQGDEIWKSKACLEGILGRPVRAFAYPYGTRSDYTEETAALVREAGFSAACSNFPAMVTRGTDVYQLPRFIVRNWSGETFARALRLWFSDRAEEVPDDP